MPVVLYVICAILSYCLMKIFITSSLIINSKKDGTLLTMPVIVYYIIKILPLVLAFIPVVNIILTIVGIIVFIVMLAATNTDDRRKVTLCKNNTFWFRVVKSFWKEKQF